MRIRVTVTNWDDEPIKGAFVQILFQELDFQLDQETNSTGAFSVDVDIGSSDSVRCLVYCNGIRQGTFDMADGDELHLQ